MNVNDLTRIDLDQLPMDQLRRLLTLLNERWPLADLYSIAADANDVVAMIETRSTPIPPRDPHPDPESVITALADVDRDDLTTNDLRRIGQALGRWGSLALASKMRTMQTSGAESQ